MNASIVVLAFELPPALAGDKKKKSSRGFSQINKTYSPLQLTFPNDILLNGASPMSSDQGTNARKQKNNFI